MRWRWVRFAATQSLVLVLFVVTAGSGLAGTAEAESFSSRVLATGFGNPWEITWGPDGFLWVTEQDTGQVSRVRPSDGSTTTLLDISEVFQTDPGAQDGLLGLALDPDWSHGHGYRRVYVAYAYDANPSPETVDDRVKIRSYAYRSDSQRLTDPVDIITGMPAGNDHNSGRLRFGPDGKLYYTIGEHGANQYKNVCKPIRSQDLPTAEQISASDWQTYQGKILRLNRDGSIPPDNPVIGGVRSHIYSYGHRNAQGIAFGPGERLYSVEHGPKTDDELNLIQPGGNYGWPHVVGYRDDQSYTYANWSASEGVPCSALTYSDYAIPSSVPQQHESDWSDPNSSPRSRRSSRYRRDFSFRIRSARRPVPASSAGRRLRRPALTSTRHATVCPDGRTRYSSRRSSTAPSTGSS
ncbi:MAG: quinoprotein glucose dehydrogenase [Solirubrobacteraceae bacterium]|jgi:PQQ-dependent dehydrogenase (s-GDH family)|nr:quinoprotein glucose dehydrogenase [Solirubrobacteraceae bacterium]